MLYNRVQLHADRANDTTVCFVNFDPGGPCNRMFTRRPHSMLEGLRWNHCSNEADVASLAPDPTGAVLGGTNAACHQTPQRLSAWWCWAQAVQTIHDPVSRTPGQVALCPQQIEVLAFQTCCGHHCCALLRPSLHCMV